MTAPVIRGNGIQSEIGCAFDGTIAVSFGDLMYYDSNDVKPFSSLSDQGTASANLTYAAQRFAGMAGDARGVADTGALTNFRVLTDVVVEMDCSSATFEVGDLVSPVETSGANALENQKVAKTTSAEQAIGRVVQRYGSATTRVLVRLTSKIAPHHTVHGVKAITEKILYSGFTDGGSTSGYKDLSTQLPAGSLLLGWKIEVLTGFTGDTSAAAKLGTSATTDRFSGVTTASVLAAGTVGCSPKGADNAFCATATTVRVTITGAADFTSIAAGEANVTLYYLQT